MAVLLVVGLEGSELQTLLDVDLGQVHLASTVAFDPPYIVMMAYSSFHKDSMLVDPPYIVMTLVVYCLGVVQHWALRQPFSVAALD